MTDTIATYDHGHTTVVESQLHTIAEIPEERLLDCIEHTFDTLAAVNALVSIVLGLDNTDAEAHEAATNLDTVLVAYLDLVGVAALRVVASGQDFSPQLRNHVLVAADLARVSNERRRQGTLVVGVVR